MSIELLLVVTALGALVGLDVVSFPQMMFSRPLVAATLGGLAVGDMDAGLTIGVVLELVALDTLPVGASRYPEWGSASVAAGALCALAGGGAAAVALVATAAVATAWVGGWSMYLLRRANGVLARRQQPALDAGTPAVVLRLQGLGIAADIARAAGITAGALILFAPLVRWLLPRWSLSDDVTSAALLALLIALAAGTVWRLVRGTSGASWLALAGLGAAVLVLVVR
ncbi:MAG TPA: PTS sugar transporter subunit IIC [Gemmatimonadaceae bacterium]|nr:PTS sugar transporter subunit IIC [Gemmatimonadaceae bacterium]